MESWNEHVTEHGLPLAEDEAPKPITDLNPVFEFAGKRWVMVTQAISSIPRRELEHPTVYGRYSAMHSRAAS